MCSSLLAFSPFLLDPDTLAASFPNLFQLFSRSFHSYPYLFNVPGLLHEEETWVPCLIIVRHIFLFHPQPQIQSFIIMILALSPS